MPTWKLTLEYQGTRYHGWQEQKNARTVAGELRQAMEKFFGKSVELSGAGRTDAGVHAVAQVARLNSDRQVAPAELRSGVNDGLPSDINILKVEPVSYRFDPRRDAIARYYLYQISLRRAAFAKRFVWWVKDRLDLDAITRAAALLPGRHDFRGFSDRRGDETSTIVVVDNTEVGTHGDLVLFRIGASHFLWKMVRRIVGTLVAIGRREISVDYFQNLLSGERGDNRSSKFSVPAHTAPPSGLFLEQISYDKGASPGPLVAAFPVRKMQ